MEAGRGATPGSEKGFSLVEALVACALIVVSAVAAAQIIGQMSLGLRNSKLTLAVDSLSEQMRSAMASRKACTQNLSGTSVSPTAPTTVANRKISFFDAAGSAVRTVVDLDAARSNEITAKALELVPGVQVTTSSYLASVRLSVEKSDVLGATFVTREFPALVDVDAAGKVVSCILNISPELTIGHPAKGATPDPSSGVVGIPTPEELCKVASGGMMAINPKTGKCEQIELTKFKGSATRAQCGAGYEFPPTMDPYFLCDATEPANFDWDSAVGSGPTEHFPDGSVQEAPVMFPQVEQETNSCSCVYRNDVPQTGWTCTANCMKTP